MAPIHPFVDISAVQLKRDSKCQIIVQPKKDAYVQNRVLVTAFARANARYALSMSVSMSYHRVRTYRFKV